MNELGEKCGYTTKTYNLLAIILVVKGQLEKAIQIYESAINDLKLDSKEGEIHLYNGNNDLASLLVNYIKCLAMNSGIGTTTEVFQSDE